MLARDRVRGNVPDQRVSPFDSTNGGIAIENSHRGGPKPGPDGPSCKLG